LPQTIEEWLPPPHISDASALENIITTARKILVFFEREKSGSIINIRKFGGGGGVGLVVNFQNV
jgi:hypothetical protein